MKRARGWNRPVAFTPMQIVVWFIGMPLVLSVTVRGLRHVVNQYWWSSLPLWQVDVAFWTVWLAGWGVAYAWPRGGARR